MFLLTTESRPALGPTQPPIQWVTGALSLGVKRPGREADHLPSSCVKVNNEWRYTPTPPIRLRGVVLSLKKSTGTTLPFPLHLPLLHRLHAQKLFIVHTNKTNLISTEICVHVEHKLIYICQT
jgi:hypothetical protein